MFKVFAMNYTIVPNTHWINNIITKNQHFDYFMAQRLFKFIV